MSMLARPPEKCARSKAGFAQPARPHGAKHGVATPRSRRPLGPMSRGDERRPVSGPRRPHGLTLIELVVALAVFAILGTLTWRGTAQLIDGGAAVDRELERWREIGRALHVIETELLQVVAPAAAAGAAPALRWSTSGEHRELELLGLAGGGTPERIAFRHIGEQIEWHRRPDVPDGAATETDVLLGGVAALSLRFFADGRWSEQWPRAGTSAALPRAVELRVALTDHGEITRIHALR